MTPRLRLSGYFQYRGTTEWYRSWKFLEPAAEIGADAGCYLFQDDPGSERAREGLAFQLRQPDCSPHTARIAELWQVEALFPAGVPAWDPPPPETPEQRDRRELLALLAEIEACLRKMRARLLRVPSSEPTPTPPPEPRQEDPAGELGEAARARLDWTAAKPRGHASAYVATAAIPALGIERGDVVVYAYCLEGRPRMFGMVRELQRPDLEALRGLGSLPFASLYADREPAWFARTRGTWLSEFLSNRRQWGARLPHSRLLVVKPVRPSAARPVLARSDAGAIFELLAAVGGAR